MCLSIKRIPGIVLPFLLGCVISTNTQAFDLLINGFGTVTASKANLKKIDTNETPVPPALTQDIAGGNPEVARVLQVPIRPRYHGTEHRWNYYQHSTFGLQFTSIFDDKFKAVVQLVGRGEILNNDHFTANMDWAYLQYDHNEFIDVQAGRFRSPAFYYSDYINVTHAQPWVAPPEEVYRIVGGSFANMDGVKIRYKHYLKDWTFYAKLYTGTFEEEIVLSSIGVQSKVRDFFGISLQAENERFSFHGSLMRGVYDFPFNGLLQTLVGNSDAVLGATPQSRAVREVMGDRNRYVIFASIAGSVRFLENYIFLAEYASILSPGVLNTSRSGMYGALTYERPEWSATFTVGYTRPLDTDVTKYQTITDFLNTTQARSTTIGSNSAYVSALRETYRATLGKSISYGLDLRYDVSSSVALKGSMKMVSPRDNTAIIKYIGYGAKTQKHVWVYKLSIDFVF